MSGGRVDFCKKEANVDKTIPSLQVIQNTLGYARELDRIV